MSWNNLIPAELLTGGVWKATDVDETPDIVLIRWSVREVDNGDHHFVGWNTTEREGRVSSRIVDYDSETMTGTTHSGRKYQLDGVAAYDPDAEYVWGQWKTINNVEKWVDVSEKYEENA